MVQLALAHPASPRSFPPPARTGVRRLRVDRHGLIYDPRAAARAAAGERPDAAALLAAIVEEEAELAETGDFERLMESIAARSNAAGEDEAADPFAGGRELVGTLEERLGLAACREIDLGIVDIGDGWEPCLAAHLGGRVEELRRLVRKAFAPFEVADG